MGKLVLETRKGTYLFPFDQIIYLENEKRKIIVHTVEGCHEFYGSLEKVIENLDDRFLLCHRSYIINMEKVCTMQKHQIVFIDGSRIYLGRDTYGSTKEKVKAYARGDYEKIAENH